MVTPVALLFDRQNIIVKISRGCKEMAKTINAIYENGVFKPLEPISLKEHEMVVSAFINRNGYPAQVNCEGEELRGKFEFININNY